MSEVTQSGKMLIAVLMIVTGAFDTLVYKTQNKQLVDEGNQHKYFFHPFMQVAAMFLGQSLALLVYYLRKFNNPEQFALREQQAQKQGKQLKFNKLIFAIPALCDCLASNLQLFALNFIAGSVYQMMRGGTIVTTFIFSLIILKIRAKPYQILGSALAFVGIAVVGVSAILFADPETVQAQITLQVVGYLMLILSLFANGFQFTYQQKLFNRYHIQPLEMVGFEGIVGFTTVCIVITVLNFIPCQFGINACAYSPDGQPYFQRVDSYFQSIGSTSLLLSFAILGVFSIMVFNVCGVSVTKYISALTRSICDVTRTLLIWIVGIIVTVTLGQTRQNYKWQSTKLNQLITQSIGFVILIAGNLIYNHIVRISCLEETSQDSTLLPKQDCEDEAME